MNLEQKTLQYYDWDDIQKALCELIGIPNENFRSYHKIVGGEYKDFWHVWLEDANVENNSYQDFHFPESQDDWSNIVEEYGDWSLKLKDALVALSKQLGQEKIVIRYYW